MKLYESFIKEVLGDHGYAAVQKAVAQMPELNSAVPSQTVLSWVETCARIEYEGNVPGTQSTFAIAKSEGGFDIRLNNERATFPSISGVAMALARALEFSPADVSNLKKEQLDQLVKSIDLLTKFNLAKAVGGGAKAPTAATPFHPATKPEGMGKPPQATRMAQVKTQIPASTVGAKPTQPKTMTAISPSMAKPPTGDSTQRKTVGASIIKPPKVKGIQAQAKKPAIAAVGKSEAARACPSCNKTAFSADEFVGCKCFSELAKSTYSKKVDDGFVIFFNYQWDADSIDRLLKTFRG